MTSHTTTPKTVTAFASIVSQTFLPVVLLTSLVSITYLIRLDFKLSVVKQMGQS